MTTVRANVYSDAADVLIAESGCTIRCYRTKISGIAYTESKDWGIEVPAPRGPVSFGVFAHEVAHQCLHRHNSTPRWLEEAEAWEWALEQFDRFDLPGAEKARERAGRSLRYAAHKATKRCTPETAQRILERMPWWVWLDEDLSPRLEAVIENVVRA